MVLFDLPDSYYRFEEKKYEFERSEKYEEWKFLAIVLIHIIIAICSWNVLRYNIIKCINKLVKPFLNMAHFLHYFLLTSINASVNGWQRTIHLQNYPLNRQSFILVIKYVFIFIIQ